MTNLWRGTEIVPEHSSIAPVIMFFSNEHAGMGWFEDNYKLRISWYMMDHDSWRGSGIDNNGAERTFFIDSIGEHDLQAMEDHIARLMGKQ